MDRDTGDIVKQLIPARMSRRATIAPTLTIEMPSSESLHPDKNEKPEADPFLLNEDERSKLAGYRLSLDASTHDMMRKISNTSNVSRTSQRSIISNTSRRSMASKTSRTSARKSTLTSQGRSGRRRSTVTRSSNFFGKM